MNISEDIGSRKFVQNDPPKKQNKTKQNKSEQTNKQTNKRFCNKSRLFDASSALVNFFSYGKADSLKLWLDALRLRSKNIREEQTKRANQDMFHVSAKTHLSRSNQTEYNDYLLEPRMIWSM